MICLNRYPIISTSPKNIFCLNSKAAVSGSMTMTPDYAGFVVTSTEFGSRLIQYFPFALEITFAYLIVGLVAHLVVIAAYQKTVHSQKNK